MTNPDAKLNPASLSLADAAKVLSAVGMTPVTVEVLQNDVLAGAPTNVDGTLNIVYYAAWLVRELSRGD